MKKILSFVFFAFLLVSSVCLLIYETCFFVNQTATYREVFPNSYWEIMKINYGILPLRLVFYAVVIAFCILVFVKSAGANHASRLTYEEYKENVKQKRLEKTRKKMQELEEKLQKESTE